MWLGLGTKGCCPPHHCGQKSLKDGSLLPCLAGGGGAAEGPTILAQTGIACSAQWTPHPCAPKGKRVQGSEPETQHPRPTTTTETCPAPHSAHGTSAGGVAVLVSEGGILKAGQQQNQPSGFVSRSGSSSTARATACPPPPPHDCAFLREIP